MSTEKHIPQPERFENVARGLDKMAAHIRHLSQRTADGFEIVSAATETGEVRDPQGYVMAEVVFRIQMRTPATKKRGVLVHGIEER